MMDNSISIVLQEAVNLLDSLPFDSRHGTHIQGRHVSVTVSIASGGDADRVRGQVYCHAFGHRHPAWSEIDVFLDVGSDCKSIFFNANGAAVFDCPRGETRTFHVLAMLRESSPVGEEVVELDPVEFQEPGKPAPPRPITIDFVSRTRGLTASAQIFGTELHLVFETHSENLFGQRVLFTLRTVERAKVASGQAVLTEFDNVWRAPWVGVAAIPLDAIRLKLMYWAVPPDDTTAD